MSFGVTVGVIYLFPKHVCDTKKVEDEKQFLLLGMISCVIFVMLRK